MGLWKGVEFRMDNQRRGWRWSIEDGLWSKTYRTKAACENSLFRVLDALIEERRSETQENEQTKEQEKFPAGY